MTGRKLLFVGSLFYFLVALVWLPFVAFGSPGTGIYFFGLAGVLGLIGLALQVKAFRAGGC